MIGYGQDPSQPPAVAGACPAGTFGVPPYCVSGAQLPQLPPIPGGLPAGASKPPIPGYVTKENCAVAQAAAKQEAASWSNQQLWLTRLGPAALGGLFVGALLMHLKMK